MCGTINSHSRPFSSSSVSRIVSLHDVLVSFLSYTPKSKGDCGLTTGMLPEKHVIDKAIHVTNQLV